VSSLRWRSRVALARQLAYQKKKARGASALTSEYVRGMREKSAAVRSALEIVRPLPRETRVLEVGCGAHGLVFFFGSPHAIGCDPLAHEYASLFPSWQRGVPTVAAAGEALPFPDGSFDVVLCDNVVDHADSPAAIASEMCRVLASGGLLYFTMNVHHSIYARLSSAFDALERFGIPLAFGPFADHTMHLTPDAARTLFAGLPLEVVFEHHDAHAVRRLRHPARRRVRDLFQRLYFKNVLFQLVAVRRPEVT
jgi:SAM-dependent methyltransferase